MESNSLPDVQAAGFMPERNNDTTMVGCEKVAGLSIVVAHR